MENVYGYKMEDLIGLANFVKTGSMSLKQLFSTYAKKCGKAIGTVRNIYYALVRKSIEDNEFCSKYLDGKPLEVSKIECFEKEQEEKLISQIIMGVESGKSVRSIVLELAKGDAKLALRYQNKYRSMLVKNPLLLQKTSKTNVSLIKSNKEVNIHSQKLIDKLKKEIDCLVDKIAYKKSQEIDFLKHKVAFLQQENNKLSRMLYGDVVPSSAVKFFQPPNKPQVFN